MFVVMSHTATEAEILGVKSRILAEGLTPFEHARGDGTVLAVVGELGGRRQALMGQLGSLAVMAGPCSVESREQLMTTATRVKAAGATVLRGGAFKPRTSPYAFQGLGVEALRSLADAREETGLPVITEVMEPNQVDIVAEYADILQIGTRNMQNYSLLTAVGRVARPVILKRGYGATVEEWLMAAEYVVSS